MVALVLACGACSDAILDSRHWWLWLVPFLVLGLLAEGVVFAVVTWLRRLESVAPRAAPTAVAFGLFTLSLISGLGMIGGFTAVTLVLLPSAAWSLIRNARFSAGLTQVRVAIIALGLLSGVWVAWPAHRSVDELVDVAVTMTRFRTNDGWIFDELRRRPEALAEVERLADRDIDVSILKLHRTLGGAASFRSAKCSQWKGRREFEEVCQ